METETITNTPEREDLLRVHYRAHRLLQNLQTARDNGLPVNHRAMVMAHNAIQASARALRMSARVGLLGVDFEEEID